MDSKMVMGARGEGQEARGKRQEARGETVRFGDFAVLIKMTLVFVFFVLSLGFQRLLTQFSLFMFEDGVKKNSEMEIDCPQSLLLY